MMMPAVASTAPAPLTVSLTNYNAPQAKQVEHTRPKPVYSVAQLTAMADSKLWKFPPATSIKPSPGTKIPSAKMDTPAK